MEGGSEKNLYRFGAALKSKRFGMDANRTRKWHQTWNGKCLPEEGERNKNVRAGGETQKNGGDSRS